jgi:hypothetical protein
VSVGVHLCEPNGGSSHATAQGEWTRAVLWLCYWTGGSGVPLPSCLHAHRRYEWAKIGGCPLLVGHSSPKATRYVGGAGIQWVVRTYVGSKVESSVGVRVGRPVPGGDSAAAAPTACFVVGEAMGQVLLETARWRANTCHSTYIQHASVNGFWNVGLGADAPDNEVGVGRKACTRKGGSIATCPSQTDGACITKIPPRLGHLLSATRR